MTNFLVDFESTSFRWRWFFSFEKWMWGEDGFSYFFLDNEYIDVAIIIYLSVYKITIYP